ncbi:MAG: hypothetical protein FWD39_03540 [Clostridiales bacterium]|nr:hypothetical protein [Clostridiales bacterium]
MGEFATCAENPYNAAYGIKNEECDGMAKKTGKVVFKDKELVCPVCSSTDFWERKTQLNTAEMTFLGLDWANKDAINYVCGHCGYMFWFHP